LAVWPWLNLQDYVDQLKFEQLVLKNIFMLLGACDLYKVAHHLM